MPATSKKQRSLSCMALAMKKGTMKETYSAQAAKMMSMSEEELTKMCHTTDEEMIATKK